MPSVVFNVAARAELLAARDWYNARNAVAAAGFSAEIEGSSSGSPQRRTIFPPYIETLAVLHQPPVDSLHAAVRAVVVAERRR